MLKVLAVILAISLAGGLLVTACVVGFGLAVVDVAVAGGPRVVVPVPLVLPRGVLATFSNTWLDQELDHEFGEDEMLGLAVVSEFVSALEPYDDAALMTVETTEGRVTISKENDDLVIRARGEHPDETSDDTSTIDLRVPLEAITSAAEPCRAALLHGDWTARGKCHPGDIARALLAEVRGLRFHIDDPDHQVRIAIH